MDFDKTSFSVDWYTPGDKHVPKRLSFPKSACISLDDFLPDSPLSLCFSPTEGPRSYSFVDTPFETTPGWANSAPPSPLVPMYTQIPQKCEEGITDWRALASPGLLSVADDCASCGVDLDVSCLDAMDEQLLLSPVECFSELCWATAVQDEVTEPVMRESARTRSRSFHGDYEPVSPPPSARDYPGSFERSRPLAARIAMPREVFPHYISAPSPLRESHDASLMHKEKPLGYFPDADPEGRFLSLPIQGAPMSTPRRSKKREQALAPTQPPTRLSSSKSSQPLRIISDAYSSITRARRR